jgi:hypothetical protein
MKRTLLLLVPTLLTLGGCQSEEPAEPLSPQAQEALKTGNTGIPPEAKAGIEAGPNASDPSRGADMKK